MPLLTVRLLDALKAGERAYKVTIDSRWVGRTDTKLLPSSQALAIAKRYCRDRKPDEPLFAILDARKTLAWINAEAGTPVQGHGLRATFASVAEDRLGGDSEARC
jgi:integrase